jgi:hypothetical protein
VNDHLDQLPENEMPNQRRAGKPTATQGGSAVYGLGLIGALLWYWRQAEEPAEYAVAVLKALVWPAFLVYQAFEVLHSMKARSGGTSD